MSRKISKNRWTKKRTRMMAGILIVIMITGISLGVVLTQQKSAEDSSPQASVDVTFSISKPPALNETAEVSAIFTAKWDISINTTGPERIAAEIILPPKYGDGFEWVGEQPRWTGKELKKGETVELSGTIKSVKTGNWTIAALMLWITTENYTLNWNVTYDGQPYIDLKNSSVFGVDRTSMLYIEVHENSAYIHEGPFPEYRPDSDENYKQLNVTLYPSLIIGTSISMLLPLIILMG